MVQGLFKGGVYFVYLKLGQIAGAGRIQRKEVHIDCDWIFPVERMELV